VKITDYASIGKAGAASKKKNVSSTGTADGEFMGLLSTDEAEAAGPAATASDIQPVSMDALLSLQEMPDDEIKKRRAVQESKGTIEALETLRLALLSGSIPEHLLHTLTKVVAIQKQRVDDPRLMSIIEDIELRAAVELAKLERASKQN
jgi:Class II flagellar assembly regulator